MQPLVGRAEGWAFGLGRWQRPPEEQEKGEGGSHVTWKNRITESQNHRIVEVGRDLCGSSSPTPLPKQGHLQ